jgi:hypothetical protein
MSGVGLDIVGRVAPRPAADARDKDPCKGWLSQGADEDRQRREAAAKVTDPGVCKDLDPRGDGAARKHREDERSRGTENPSAIGQELPRRRASG